MRIWSYLPYLFEIADITSITTAFVIGVFDILAHVFPGEKGFEAGYFGSVVADLEDQVDNGDRSGTPSIG